MEAVTLCTWATVMTSVWSMSSRMTPHPILHANPKDRSAVLVVTSIGHWRRNLINMGSQLPKLGEHSWHVEVFDRQVGYLGLFRQSRVTGKWFMGKHSVHMRGNPSPQS